MKNIFQNWKTTSAGIIMISSGLAIIINNHAMITESLTPILAGLGLLFAADSKTTQ